MIEQAQLQQQLLAEALPDGLAILDEKFRLCWWNSVVGDLLGLDNEEDKTAYITDIITDKHFQDLIYNKRNTTIHLASPKTPAMKLALMLRSYSETQYLLIIKDITHTIHLEAMRQDFIANVSHELRTPLTVFRGYLELLKNHNNLDQQQLIDILEHMENQSGRMERLVEDLLLLSRLESNEPDLESHQYVPVASLLRNIYEDAQSFSGENEHEFHLHLDENLTLYGQSEELRSAFSNLIFNAVQYTPAKGRIDIYWYQDEKAKYFKVTDTGIGIPEKYIPRITQRFYRVDKSRSYRGKGGTGLGLAIVKHVLLRHHGSLHIESKVDKGSHFCCQFFS